MVSWAHQRTRDLADQFLDDAHSFRDRCAARADGLRFARLAIVDTVLGVPFACRERLNAFALASRRAGSKAAEAVLNLAWTLTQGAGWILARHRGIVALAAAPVVLALALVFAFSSSAA